MGTGEDCEQKSEFAYIAGGITGADIFVILLVLLIWMICVRATRTKKPEKAGLGPGAEVAHQGVPNFYNEGYMKEGLASLASGKMNSLARPNASLYGNKEELYDRLRRHAYQGGKKEKSNNETTSDSDDGRQ